MASAKKQHMTILLVVIFAVGIYLYVAHTHDKPLPINPAQVTITPSEAQPVPKPLVVKSQYHTLVTTTTTPGAELAAEVGLSNVPFVLALNRMDVKHIPLNATLVIPDSFDNPDAYSPFPEHIDAAANIPKLLIVSQRVQAFAAYENGTRVRWGTVSTGKSSTPTPSDLYSTNWKGKMVTSSIEEDWVMPWYFNLNNKEGISIHQFDLPGYPASHSCIRLSESDAMWFYDWADQWILAPDGQTKLADGTPVIIYGDYAYGKTAPWKKLPTDPTATTLSSSEVSDIVTKYAAEIQKRADTRNQVLGTQ